MSKKRKKKKCKLKDVVLVFSIIQSLAATICMIYETFFKLALRRWVNPTAHRLFYSICLKMSMIKTITISTWVTFICLCYLAIKNGLDIFIGVAILTSALSGILDIIYLKRGDN